MVELFGLACVSGWYSGFLAELEPGQNNAQAVAAEVERCKVPEFAKAMGHEDKWKLHNNCR